MFTAYVSGNDAVRGYAMGQAVRSAATTRRAPACGHKATAGTAQDVWYCVQLMFGTACNWCLVLRAIDVTTAVIG
jgi:hypothetical protein